MTSWIFQTKKIFVINSIFFTVIWTQTAGFVTALNPLSPLFRISCRFQFHNLWRAWNGQHRFFHNLALFSIYGNDGASISRRSVIINLKKYHQKKVQLESRCRKLNISAWFQLHTSVDMQFISWNESQTKVIHALNMIISYFKRSNFLWCPTLVLLSQTCFLLLLFGSYGYDRSCWFQAKMIVNIRNELPSSCLGSLHQNDICPWMIEFTKWHIHDKIKNQFQETVARLLSTY